jgi:hypothetical protein
MKRTIIILIIAILVATLQSCTGCSKSGKRPTNDIGVIINMKNVDSVSIDSIVNAAAIEMAYQYPESFESYHNNDSAQRFSQYSVLFSQASEYTLFSDGAQSIITPNPAIMRLMVRILKSKGINFTIDKLSDKKAWCIHYTDKIYIPQKPSS